MLTYYVWFKDVFHNLNIKQIYLVKTDGEIRIKTLELNPW